MSAPAKSRPAADLQVELEGIRRADLWRRCVPVDSPSAPRIRAEGCELLNLCSNNYLDLARHPRVVEAARKAASRWGAGAGAARLINGTQREAVELERELAEFKGTEAALLFSSGYMANLGLIPTLAGPGDVLFCDRLNHASLIDAARLSRAETRVYPHNDMEALRDLLKAAPAEARKLIVTDGVFSMDGDVAPLDRLNELACEFDAWLAVDDAHGTGVVGPEGRGCCAAMGIAGDRVVQIVTLSKALGSQGGAVVGSREVVDLLINRARTFIFETALAPPAVAAARAALRIVLGDADRRERLHRNIRTLREALAPLGFEFAAAETPIFPLILGENARALAAADALFAEGYWITAIRPPTVPEGTARLRMTAMSEHSPEDLQRFARDFARILKSEGD